MSASAVCPVRFILLLKKFIKVLLLGSKVFVVDFQLIPFQLCKINPN
jgi:hypothetical protein